MDVRETLALLTKKKNIILTDRGNTAIKFALKIVKKGRLGIPNQGGWITYKQFGNKLKFDVLELPTDHGVFDPNTIPTDLDVLLLAHPAGYFAAQPVEAIYKHCKKHNIVVILDVTGAIGSDFYAGGHADIIIASFAETKPVNASYGGCICFDDEFLTSDNCDILNDISFDDAKMTAIERGLSNLTSRHQFLADTRKKILSDLSDFNVLHREKAGINVVVGFDSEDQKNELINYCKRYKYEYVLCPRNIKVNCDAISIEVKRLV